jgi:hypothetical protein
MMNNESDICPCIDCILIPICRHKPYPQVFEDCHILTEHISDYYDEPILNDSQRLKTIQQILNPTMWKYDKIPGLKGNVLIMKGDAGQKPIVWALKDRASLLHPKEINI